MTLSTRPKPPVHHKKRTGEHQRRHKHFTQTYWPYLPMISVVALSIAFSTIWANKANVLGAQSDLSTTSLLSATNDARLSDHEQQLSVNVALNAAAQAKAYDMAARNYWSHDAPDGKTPWDFIASTGYSYQKAGENLAYGFANADTTVTAWLNSPEHRANLLNTDYREVGFGVASSPNYQSSGPETIVVAMYGAPVNSALGITATVENHDVKGVVAPVKTVARLQLVAGKNSQWAVFVASTLVAVGLALLIIRHGRAWHRVLVKSETFVLNHPLFDITIVVVVSASFVLTRAAGFIG